MASPSDSGRLNSWKSIAAYFGRDERTVKRWEAERGLPVHRIPGARGSSVYAYTTELTRWLQTANLATSPSKTETLPESQISPADAESTPAAHPHVGRTKVVALNKAKFRVLALVCLAILAVATFAGYRYFASHLAMVSPSPRRLDRSISSSPEARELYLQGLYHWNKRTAGDLHQAVDDFTQSIVQDPNYAPAYVGLANCYNLLREYSLMPASEAYPRAIAAAQRAIALDDSLAEAHNSLAFADFYWSWDAVGAEREFRRSLELDPRSALAHHWYATFLMVLGRAPESLTEIEKARTLDPRSPAILADKGLILFTAGHVSQSIALLKEMEASDPSFLSPHTYLATIYLDIKDYENYLAEARKSAVILHDQNRLRIVTAGVKGFAAAGDTGMLRAQLRVQQALYARNNLEAYELALTYNLLGDKQQALELLQISVDRHEERDVALRVDQSFQTLHNDPTFRKLLSQVDLPSLD